MELQEYHTKRFFRRGGLPVLKGEVAYTPDEAQAVADKMRGEFFIVKAQLMKNMPSYGVVLSPDVSCADGCQVVPRNQVAVAAEQILTANQADAIQKVYIEKWDAGSLFCRVSLRVDFVVQNAILTVEMPDGKRLEYSLSDGKLTSKMMAQITRDMVLRDVKLKAEMHDLLKKLFSLFDAYGAMAIELNPVIVTDKKTLIVGDGRLIFDPESLFKFPEVIPLIEGRIGQRQEVESRKNGFRYTRLSGNIACLVNGSGLARATVDLVHAFGGQVACLLDVGTEPSKDAVTKALRLALGEPNVDGILVNIFGGLTRCDLIAQGLIAAAPEMATGLPIVVRMDGTNAQIGRRLLFESRLPFEVMQSLTDAVSAIVQHVQKEETCF